MKQTPWSTIGFLHLVALELRRMYPVSQIQLHMIADKLSAEARDLEDALKEQRDGTYR